MKGKIKKTYWREKENERMYLANCAFMDAIMDLCFTMRFKLGWQICCGTNPLTGKKHKRGKK